MDGQGGYAVSGEVVEGKGKALLAAIAASDLDQRERVDPGSGPG